MLKSPVIQKRSKVFEYLKKKSGPNDILFFQETHSTNENEIRWNDDFKSQMHYSHGKSDSCRVHVLFLLFFS